jgi:hypothetical protein
VVIFSQCGVKPVVFSGVVRLNSRLTRRLFITMNALLRFHCLIWFCAAVGFGSTTLAVVPTVPDERDRQVLETLMLHLLSDTNFDVTRVPATNGTSILLHVRTPDKTGFLMSQQIHGEIRNQTLPEDAENDMRRRNTPLDAKPDTYDSVPVTYTNLTFAAGIVITNLNETWTQRNSFEQTHPKARGWLDAYLPGYSADGTRAVVRAGVGPWAHAAMLTAVLEKVGDKWVVKWYHVARFV